MQSECDEKTTSFPISLSVFNWDGLFLNSVLFDVDTLWEMHLTVMLMNRMLLFFLFSLFFCDRLCWFSKFFIK